MWVYNYSHLARYTEEALAESVAQLRTRGNIKDVIGGIHFPLQGYDISKRRLILESTAVTTVVIAGGIGTGMYILPPIEDAWDHYYVGAD
jgi:hypothetical protein